MVMCSGSWPFYMNSNSKTTPSVNLNHGILFRINKKNPDCPNFRGFFVAEVPRLEVVGHIDWSQWGFVQCGLERLRPWALGNGMAGGSGGQIVFPLGKRGGGVGFNFVLEFGGGSNVGSHPGRCNVMFFCFLLCTQFRCTSMGKQDCDFVEDFCMFTAGICGQGQVYVCMYLYTYICTHMQMITHIYIHT